jgi:aspartyl-tRNA(Asn)/glutamyl-tRNA(Gln) amidotransferase subunit C
MAIDRATVEYVARLSRLALSEAEREAFTRQLREILDYFARLQTLDLSTVPPTAHVHEGTNLFREDVPRPSLPRDEVLAAAPEVEEGFFVVPAVLEEAVHEPTTPGRAGGPDGSGKAPDEPAGPPPDRSGEGRAG